MTPKSRGAYQPTILYRLRSEMRRHSPLAVHPRHVIDTGRGFSCPSVRATLGTWSCGAPHGPHVGAVIPFRGRPGVDVQGWLSALLHLAELQATRPDGPTSIRGACLDTAAAGEREGGARPGRSPPRTRARRRPRLVVLGWHARPKGRPLAPPHRSGRVGQVRGAAVRPRGAPGRPTPLIDRALEATNGKPPLDRRCRLGRRASGSGLGASGKRNSPSGHRLGSWFESVRPALGRPAFAQRRRRRGLSPPGSLATAGDARPPKVEGRGEQVPRWFPHAERSTVTRDADRGAVAIAVCGSVTGTRSSSDLTVR
jgi:hypothetical protein